MKPGVALNGSFTVQVSTLLMKSQTDGRNVPFESQSHALYVICCCHFTLGFRHALSKEFGWTVSILPLVGLVNRLNAHTPLAHGLRYYITAPGQPAHQVLLEGR
jgi:hypothetical protein